MLPIAFCLLLLAAGVALEGVLYKIGYRHGNHDRARIAWEEEKAHRSTLVKLQTTIIDYERLIQQQSLAPQLRTHRNTAENPRSV